MTATKGTTGAFAASTQTAASPAAPRCTTKRRRRLRVRVTPNFTGVLTLLDCAGKGASKKSLHVDRRRQDASVLEARGQWASLQDLRFACRAATLAFRRIVDACRRELRGEGGAVPTAHLRFALGWMLAAFFININAVRSQAYYNLTLEQWRAVRDAVIAAGTGLTTETAFKTAATYGFQSLAFDANMSPSSTRMWRVCDPYCCPVHLQVAALAPVSTPAPVPAPLCASCSSCRRRAAPSVASSATCFRASSSSC